MYFKDFPKFLYDFNYDGANNTTKTSLVRDITRNIRFRRDILSNITLYDEYDIIDGETPEIIAEKFYGSPEYHWVVMLANEKFDYLNDFPLQESELQRHVETTYNPTLYSDDWYWDTHVVDGEDVIYIHLRVSTDAGVPFNPDYLTAPVKITLYDETRQFVKVLNFPVDEVGLDPATQYFYFPYNEPWDISQFGTGTTTEGVGTIRIYIDTEGREHNPVKFVNAEGFAVNPGAAFATAVTGDQLYRQKNDELRRIKLISPKLLATVLRNYKELL